MSRVSPFQAFLAGALCFFAGVAISSGFAASPGWTHREVSAVVLGALLLAEGMWMVRRLYLRQR